MSNGAPPPPPPAPSGHTAAAKKGLSPLAWVAIGCGGLLVVGFIAFVGLGLFAVKKVKDVAENPVTSVAKLYALGNPDLDLVEADESTGQVTFRNNKTDELVTVDYNDIKEGNLTFKTAEGDVTFDASGTQEGGGSLTISTPQGETRFGAGQGADDVPDWVPLYPGAEEPQSLYSATAQGKTSGATSMSTSDDPETVMEHYKQLLEDEGYEVQVTRLEVAGSVQGGVTAQKQGEERSINVAVTHQDGKTQVTINYNG